MMPGEFFHWLAAIGAGFLLGSVMFSEIIPRRVLLVLFLHGEVAAPGNQDRGDTGVNGMGLIDIFRQLAGV